MWGCIIFQTIFPDHSSKKDSFSFIILFISSVGGISVTEKFELSVVPLSMQITYRFFKKMMAFFFPRHNVDQETSTEDSPRGKFS